MFRIDWVSAPDELAAAQAMLGNIEPQSHVALLREAGQALGALSVEFANGTATLRIFVIPQRRGEGFGDILLRTALLRAVSKETLKLLLFVPKELSSWPLRLGFLETGRVEDGLAEFWAYPEDIETGCRGQGAEPSPPLV